MKYFEKYPYPNRTSSVDFSEVEGTERYHGLSTVRVDDRDYFKIESFYKGRATLYTYRGCVNHIVDPGIIKYHQEVHGASSLRIEFNPEDLTFFHSVYIDGKFIESHCSTLYPDFSAKTIYTLGRNYRLIDYREYKYLESGDEESLKIFFPDLWHIDFDEY